MQSRLSLAHFLVFLFCGFMSIAACCIGVFGVITHDVIEAQQNHVYMVSEKVQDVRDAITHPKNKKWEPVLVLSRNDTLSLLED